MADQQLRKGYQNLTLISHVGSGHKIALLVINSY